MSRSRSLFCFLRRVQPARQLVAVLTAWLTLFGSQYALAQNSCPNTTQSSAPPPASPPTVSGSLQLNVQNQLLPQQTVVNNLSVGSLIPVSSTGGISSISVYSATGPCPLLVTGTLIKQYCQTPYGSDVLQYQADKAQEFLSLFQIQAPDGNTAVQMILQRSNLNLLSAYYGYMLADLEALISLDPSTLTPHQSNVISWFGSQVYAHELAEYQAAWNEVNKFNANPCSYMPDADINAQYNLSYNIDQCTGLGGLFGGPVTQTPPSDYFLAVGMKNSYGSAVSSDPNGAVLNEAMLTDQSFTQRAAYELNSSLTSSYQQTQSTYSKLEAAAPGTGAAVGSAYFVGSSVFFSSVNTGGKVIPYAYRTAHVFADTLKQGTSAVRAVTIRAASSSTSSEVETYLSQAFKTVLTRVGQIIGVDLASDVAGPASIVSGGPAAIVTIFVTILQEAITQLVDYEANKDQINNINNTLQSLQSPPANTATFLTQFLNDSSGTGQYKLASTLTAAVDPLPAFVSNYPTEQGPQNLAFLRTLQGSTSASASQTVTVADWDGASQTVSFSGGWFTISKNVGSAAPVVSRTPILRYLDWTGRQWWASRFGDEFLVVKNGYESQSNGDQFQDVGGCGINTPFSQSDASLFQQQQPSSGVSNAYCSSFVSHTIQAQSTSGINFTVQSGAYPILGTGQANIAATFQPGGTDTVTVPVVGDPAPTVSVNSQYLPKGFTASVGSDGTVTIFDGNATSSGSTGQAVIQASNAFGTVSQIVSITENKGSEVPTVSIPTGLQLHGGQPFSIALNLTGNVIATQVSNFSTSSPLAGGNANDQFGTLSGVKLEGVQSTYTLSGTPILQATFIGKPNGLPVTGTISFNIQILYQSEVNGSGVQTTQTVKIPYAYIPSANPSYQTSPVVMYNGKKNSVTLSPLTMETATGEPTLANLTYSGDTACASYLYAVSAPNGLIQLVADLSVTEDDGTLVLLPFHRCIVSFTPQAPGSDQPAAGTPTVNIPVTFLSVPSFTSIANPVFKVGTPVSFSVGVNVAGFPHPTGPLPPGLTQVNDYHGSLITGTPTAGGEFQVPYVASIADGSTGQTLDIKIWQPPAFTSSPFVNVPLGQTSVYTVTTSGYPNLSSDPCGGMNFTVTPLNGPGLTFSNTNLNYDSTGNLKLTIPAESAPQFAEVGVTATNSAGSASTGLTVRYYVPGDANNDGVANCTDVNLVRAFSGQTTNANNFIFDLNNDGVINSKDLLLVTKYLPAGTRCQ